MDASNTSVSGLLKILLPRVPLLLRTTGEHALGISPTASQWNLKTALTINMIRSFTTSEKAIELEKEQALGVKDPGVKGQMWVSKCSISIPENSDVKERMFEGIEGLKEGSETFYDAPVQEVTGEWMGHRAGVDKKAPELDISEEEKYKHLMKEVESDLTVLYIHGGAY
jgi:hypothetical protein